MKLSFSSSLNSDIDSLTTAMIAKPMGSNMIVVEVFIIHMLSKHELTINPAMIDLPLVPVNLRMVRAMRLCRLHFWIAIERKKPPKNKKIFLFA